MIESLFVTVAGGIIVYLITKYVIDPHFRFKDSSVRTVPPDHRPVARPADATSAGDNGHNKTTALPRFLVPPLLFTLAACLYAVFFMEAPEGGRGLYWITNPANFIILAIALGLIWLGAAVFAALIVRI